MAKVIGIISLKGGVGKTSTVAALGEAIAQLGKKVLLIDGNFSAPNLGLHLNIIDPEITLHEVLNGDNNLNEAIYPHENFDILPSKVFNKKIISPLKLKNKIKSLKRKYDIILIDSSPALNEETLAVMLASDGLLVVTTPDVPTMSNTIKAVRLAKNRGTPILGLILNKVHNKNFEISLDNIEETAQVPVMAVIPHELNHLRALSEFIPSTARKPNTKGSKEYKKLAATLMGEKYNSSSIKEMLKFSPKRQEINRIIFYETVFS